MASAAGVTAFGNAIRAQEVRESGVSKMVNAQWIRSCHMRDTTRVRLPGL